MFDIQDAQLETLSGLEREAGGLYVRQCDALLALWDEAPEDSRVGRRPHVLAEAATALQLHPQSVESRLGVALWLRTHPLLRALLRDGRLLVAHALVTVDELGALGDDALAARVLRAVLACDGRLGWDGTPAELRRALRRAAIRLDPAAAARRRAEAGARSTGVRLRPLPDGLAALVSTGQAEQLSAADRLLDVLSRPTGPDDSRTRGQRQIDALLSSLVARAGSAVPFELQLEIPVQVKSTRPVGPSCPPEPVTIAADLGADLLALLSGAALSSAAPGRVAGPEAPGAPTAPAGPADHAAPASPAAPDPRTGSRRVAVPADPPHPGTEAPPSSQAESDGAPATCPATADPPPVDVHARDHVPAATRLRRHTAGPELTGHGTVDPALLVELLDDPTGMPVGLGAVQVRRVCVDPRGQVVAVDDRAVPLARLLAGGRATTDNGRAAELLGRLVTGLPTPPPVTGAYTPTAAQARVLRARDAHCTFPGCGRRSQRCELDHRVPHPLGPTSVSNLQSACKHHHRLKHDGWTCLRDADGTTTWTSPRGASRVSRPQ